MYLSYYTERYTVPYHVLNTLVGILLSQPMHAVKTQTCVHIATRCRGLYQHVH